METQFQSEKIKKFKCKTYKKKNKYIQNFIIFLAKQWNASVTKQYLYWHDPIHCAKHDYYC